MLYYLLCRMETKETKDLMQFLSDTYFPSLGNWPGGGTWVFFGWLCTARDSKLAPLSKTKFP